MAKKDDFTHFTFRFDRALREKAERLAEEDRRALGVWVSLVVADRVAAAEAARPPARSRKTRELVTAGSSR